jgi:hypothetical protein
MYKEKQVKVIDGFGCLIVICLKLQNLEMPACFGRVNARK